MDKEEIIRRLKKISEHAVHVAGEPPFIMSLDDGIALDEAVRLLKEQEAVVRCKDCILQECPGRDGLIVCDKDGDSHTPDWFCANGERRE